MKHFLAMLGCGVLGSGTYGFAIAGVNGALIMWLYGSLGIVLSALLGAMYCESLAKR